MLTKPMKVLVAYDGSACADAALEDLRRAGLPPDTEVVVISVADSWLLPSPPPSSYEIVEAASAARADVFPGVIPADVAALELATMAAERIRTHFPLWTVRAEVAEGSPAKEIINKAKYWEPDLIVLGSHGRSSLGRLVLGSVSQKVVAEAGSSVRVARSSSVPERDLVRVAIGVDGSLASRAAVREVASRDWPPNSEALVMHAATPLMPTAVGSLIPKVTTWLGENNLSENQWIRKILDNAVLDLQQAGLIAKSAVFVGDPKRVLVEGAERCRADCIFVSSLGFGSRIERFLLGSVSAAVAARAHCTVEVVRSEKRQNYEV